jgi:hypothetical protein
MTQIIGFAGKKQSGKNTCCNFITMLKLLENGVCKNARLTKEGEIEVTDVFGDGLQGEEWFLFKNPPVNTEAVLNGMNAVKIYALADGLKRVAIDVLGLPEDKVYGTDADKMTETHLLWENMPGVITQKLPMEFETVEGRLGFYYASGEYTTERGIHIPLVYHEPGPMTIREVLQFMGTEIFRKMYDTVWVDALIRRIEKDKPQLALVCDVRFDNEIVLLKKAGAIILGLERDIFKSKDTHASEQVNLQLCNKIIQNGHLSIGDQNKEIYIALQQMNCKNLTDLGV